MFWLRNKKNDFEYALLLSMPVIAYAQTCQSLCCFHTQSKVVDEDITQKFGQLAPLDTSAAEHMVAYVMSRMECYEAIWNKCVSSNGPENFR